MPARSGERLLEISFITTTGAWRDGRRERGLRRASNSRAQE
jgi:hypothetical protein